MMLAMVGAALAGPIFLQAGDEVYLNATGNWPRAFPTDTGWDLFYATEGKFWHQTMDDALETSFADRTELTGHHDLQDHAISKCPDGTWLHVATASHVEPNDSLYAFIYDADLNLVAETTIADGDTTGMYVDVPSVCGEHFRGTAYWYDSVGQPMRFIQIDEAGAEVDRTNLTDAPVALGSSLIEDEGHLFAIGFGSKTDADNVLITEYDGDLGEVGYIQQDVTPDGWTGYWSQGAQRVGNVYLVVHMAEDDRYEWTTQGGDLWISAFDLAWNPIDELKLSSNTAPDGGMQPGLAVKGDQVLALYSRESKNYAYVVTIDLAAAEAWEDPRPHDTADTGAADTGGDDDDGGSLGGPIPAKRECDCATGTAPGWLGLVAILAVARRRAA